MPTLNLGILAHVDAGKTSLTERLLLDAGVLTELGSVDAGSTRTDSLALERARGITIKSAVVSFRLGDYTVNLIDTPGHPDFIAEVERVLSVLDGAVLVVSAVEGVQAQTRVLLRTLRRLHIPTLIQHASCGTSTRAWPRRSRSTTSGHSPSTTTRHLPRTWTGNRSPSIGWWHARGTPPCTRCSSGRRSPVPASRR
jgi:small GTP-binding protein